MRRGAESGEPGFRLAVCPRSFECQRRGKSTARQFDFPGGQKAGLTRQLQGVQQQFGVFLQMDRNQTGTEIVEAAQTAPCPRNNVS